MVGELLTLNDRKSVGPNKGPTVFAHDERQGNEILQ